ncbi:hypothetical protein SFMTTN_2891 [Sulfuriferula multivorans]|uniref:Uncharacterized protein n=1 Tax=Sulfuriferula multivorans TaxID=1559896 RepID=A0A401JZN7_9PROT|nr:hypothetical protein SFMTTN_2891 [Sulfuriferula multivorans]
MKALLFPVAGLSPLKRLFRNFNKFNIFPIFGRIDQSKDI